MVLPFATSPSILEDFNGTSLNRKLWPVVYGNEKATRGGFWWRNDYTKVSSGRLILTTAQRSDGVWESGGCSMIPKPWEPGYSFQYGRVEIIARMTRRIYGAGMCILLWPDTGDWTDEIDIVETPKDKGMFTVHQVQNGQDDYVAKLFDCDFTKFNVFTCEWTPHCVALKVNGEVVRAIDEIVPNVPMSLGIQGHIGEPGNGWYGEPQDGAGRFDIVVQSVKIWPYQRA